MKYNPVSDTFYEDRPSRSTTTSVVSTSYWCKEHGKPCEYATENGYCKVTACLKRN